MLCAISGEAPEVPVASRKSGSVFERRLIEAYISEHGKDPVTGEDLTVDDLLDLKSARVVKPRPPTLTSIPSLLSVFQQEWDALALESYQLKQHVNQLRNELSSALYNNDAAIRVIARLTKERDEARDALAKMSLNDQRGTTNGGGHDAMQVDGAALSETLVAKVEATQEQLSKTRRKRPVPQDWATVDEVQAYNQAEPVQLVSGGTSLALNARQNIAVLGAADGSCCIYPLAGQGNPQTISGGSGSVTDVALWEKAGQSLPVIATSSGVIKIFNSGEEHASFTEHAGAVTGLSLHPCGSLLGSVSVDKSFAFYDLESMRLAARVYTNSQLNCCQFHPDGHIFAAGAADGQIKIFDVKTGESMATFDDTGPIQALSFSENGTWLAAVVEGATSVSIWDLRKGAEIKALEFGSVIRSVQWDYTGQYLAGAGAGCVAVQHYDKATKEWSEPLRKAISSVSVAWGAQAKSLVVLDRDGALQTLQ